MGSVVSGQWSVVSGQWSVVSGQWSVVRVRVKVSRRRTAQKSMSSCTSNSATVDGPKTQARTVPPTTSAEPITIRLVILACAVKKCAKTRLLTNWLASGLGLGLGLGLELRSGSVSAPGLGLERGLGRR